MFFRLILCVLSLIPAVCYAIAFLIFASVASAEIIPTPALKMPVPPRPPTPAEILQRRISRPRIYIPKTRKTLPVPFRGKVLNPPAVRVQAKPEPVIVPDDWSEYSMLYPYIAPEPRKPSPAVVQEFGDGWKMTISPK